jgi:hypothetical protein
MSPATSFGLATAFPRGIVRELILSVVVIPVEAVEEQSAFPVGDFSERVLPSIFRSETGEKINYANSFEELKVLDIVHRKQMDSLEKRCEESQKQFTQFLKGTSYESLCY